MRKNKFLITLLFAFLPILAMSASLCPINEAKAEAIDFKGIKAEPFQTRYSTTDIVNEPESQNSYDLNFAHMNLGGDSLKNASIWDEYRGETLTNDKVTVAVIDTGIDIYHEDFLKPEARGKDITFDNIAQYSILDPKSCYVHDTGSGNETATVVTEIGYKHCYDINTLQDDGTYYSHGTASAACIGASVNGMGGFGIAPNVNLLIIKIDFLFTSLDVAIRYAADNGADVINMSLGAYSVSFTDSFGFYHQGFPEVAYLLEDAIKYANSKDVVVVAAAGNEDTAYKSYPACNTGVVGVGALDRTSGTDPAVFTNFNTTSDSETSENNVDVMAPGYVWTANVPNNEPRKHHIAIPADSYYSETQGTSFASPLTAGAIALYRGKFPEQGRQEVIDSLFSSCADLGAPNWDNRYGYGRVDVENYLVDPIKVTKVDVTPKNVTLTRSNDNPNPTQQLSVSFTPSDATPSYKRGLWISEDDNIAKVDENTGLVTAKRNGETDIYFITNNDMIEDKCHVVVNGHVDYIESDEILKITAKDHNLGGEYGWKSWTVGDYEGESYVYGKTSDRLQFNSIKGTSYTFNKTALPGEITSIVLKGTGNSWQVLTDTTSFGQHFGNPTNGNDAGTRNITSNGVTYNVDGLDTYFAIVYKGSGAGYLNSIEINYKGYKIPPKTVSLDKTEAFLKVGETTTLKATANGTVTWQNSNPSVASFENGIIKALKIGTTTITATNGTAIAKCVVSVVPEYSLLDIKLSGNIPNQVPFKGSIDTSEIIVTANYSHNHPSKVVDATFSKLDTNILGPQDVVASYKENGVTRTASFEVFVSNYNAIRHEQPGDGAIINSETSKDNYFKTDYGYIIGENDAIWDLSVKKNGNESTYYGFNGNDHGSQIGSSSSNIPTDITISSESFYEDQISKVEIKVKSENANLAILSEGKPLKCDNKTSIKTSKVMKTYLFQGLGAGMIDIKLSNVSQIVVIGYIKVTLTGGSSFTWTGDDQAKAFVDYLKTFRTCAADWENRRDIVKLVNEFNYMIQDSKNSSLIDESFDDHGYRVSPMLKLKTIIDEYNRSLKDGETKLKLILTTDGNGNPTSTYESYEEMKEFIDSSAIIFIISAVAVILITSGVITLIIKHPRHDK